MSILLFSIVNSFHREVGENWSTGKKLGDGGVGQRIPLGEQGHCDSF